MRCVALAVPWALLVLSWSSIIVDLATGGVFTHTHTHTHTPAPNPFLLFAGVAFFFRPSRLN